MADKYFTLKTVNLNNHCPECYSTDGLELTFKQKFVENVLYKAISTETSHNLHCNTCDTAIYPARWTDDIDRVFNYQQKAAVLKPKSIKLKPLAWVVIALDLLIIAAIVYFFLFKN